MIEVDEITLAYLQINNPTLACNFSDFTKAVSKVLGRPVWSHQYRSKSVLEEKGMYVENSGDISENLCREKIVELVNKKFEEWCKKE